MSAPNDPLPPEDQGKPLTSGHLRLIRLLAVQAVADWLAAEKRKHDQNDPGPADIPER